MNEAVRTFQAQFRQGPGLLVQALDSGRDRVLVASLSEADYREASFLDGRILAGGRPCQWLPWGDLERVAGAMPGNAQFIFHIGHVGSTLISRLLGELPGIFSVREPVLLRDLAEIQRTLGKPHAAWAEDVFEPRMETALGWLSRTFRPQQRALIKATSFVSELAPRLTAPGRKAIALYAQPQTYSETILAGEASLQELGAYSASRLQRLHARLGEEPWRLWQLSLGERIAMGWACEMTALGAAAAEAGEGVQWLDIDDFFAAPGEKLTEAAAHFGQALAGDSAQRLVAGPIMTRYSKAPEHAYSPDLRRQLLAQARAEHEQELRRGAEWLEQAARRYPIIAAALERGQKG